MDPWETDRGARRSGNRFAIARTARKQAAIGISVVCAPFADAALIGTTSLDWIWASLLAGTAALLATTAKRDQLLAASVLAALTARSYPTIGIAALAVGAAALSTRKLNRRAVFARGISGGATVICLLASDSGVPAWQMVLSALAVAALLVTGAWRRASSRRRRSYALGFGIVGAAWLGATLIAGLGLLANADRLQTGASELRLGLAAARRGEVDNAASHLEIARDAMENAKTGLDRYGFAARAFPGTAQQMAAVVDVLDDVQLATTEARRAAAIVAGDRLAVRTGTIDLAAMSELRTPLSRLTRALGNVVAEVKSHDHEPILPPLRDKLDELRDESEHAWGDASRGSQAAASLPAALGQDGDRHYLVLFTSPAEARGRFGFPGSFAAVTFRNGRFLLGEHGSTSQLLEPAQFDQRGFDLGDSGVRPYAELGATRAFLSSTIPPDLGVVSRNVREMWRQSGRGELDGVLRFDPASLAPLLAFTGPVKVAGLTDPLTAQNVEEFLIAGQYLQYKDAATPRREVLDTVASTTFERLETANLPNPRTLFDLFAPLVRTDHLQITSTMPDVAALMHDIDIDGRLDVPASDGAMVTTVNGLGNKIDAFLSTSLKYTGTVRSGTVDATLRVDLTNGAPASGLADYVIGSFAKPAPPRGTNRSTVFLYTAAPIDSATVDGQSTTVVSGQSNGWWVHRLEVSIPPGGTVSVELHVAGELPEGPYELLLEPTGGTQPGTHSVDLQVDGRRVAGEGRTDGPVSLR